MYKKYCGSFQKRLTDKWSDVPPAFGKDMRTQEFLMSDNLRDFAGGSYGTVAKKVHEAASQVRLDIEADPNQAIRRAYTPERDRVAQIVADFLQTDLGNITFCHNATTGIANILTSYPFQAGDVVLYNNLTYNAMKNQIQDLVDGKRAGVQSYEMQHPFTINSKEEIIEQYETALTENPSIKLAVIDHISSMPAILFPVKELIDVCHAHGVDVLVDGAHCPGHIPLNLDELGADFYVGNLHKWMYALRPSAIQYVAPRFHDVMTPAVRSTTAGGFPVSFGFQGTDDQTKYFTAETAILFCEWVGGQAAISAHSAHIFELLPDLIAAWGTELLPVPTDMDTPNMRTFRIPDMPAYDKTSDGLRRLSDDLHGLYGIWVSISLFQDELWMRICANIYLDQEDLVKLKDAILELQAQEPDSDQQKLSRARYEERKKVQPYTVIAP